MVMEKPSPLLVGREFVRQYYTLLNQAPDMLHRFALTGLGGWCGMVLHISTLEREILQWFVALAWPSLELPEICVPGPPECWN